MRKLTSHLNNDYQILATKQETELQFLAEIEFGSPSKNCQNYGICRLNIAKQYPLERQTQKHSCGSKYLAQVNYLENRSVTLKFSKLNLGDQAIQKYFGEDIFRVDEDFQTFVQLDSSTEKKCLSIKKGHYPIIENDTHYTLRFSG